MEPPAISVENVGKWYRLGGGGASDGLLSERLGAFLRAPARMVRRGVNSDAEEADRFWALRGASLEVARGEAVGLVGSNGAGKSTLLKLLSRITPPSEGEITLRGRVATLLEVGTGFHPELSGRENIFLNGAILGMRRREIESRLDEIIEFSGIEQFIDVPIKRYSSGMYVRLAFAVAAHLEPEILLVDEVLAVGDAEFQRKCIGRMQDVTGEGRTVVFVSHNLAAVERLCGRCYWIRNGQVAAAGPTAEVIANYLKAVGGAQHGGVAEIPRETPRVGGKGARLTRVELRSGDGELTDQVSIGGRIAVTVHFSVLDPIDAAVVEIGLSGADGTRVVTAHSTDGGGQPFPLASGDHEIAVELEAFLLPGDFTIDVALHDATALTHDAVDRALAFAVLNIGAEEDRYPWATVRGAVRLPSSWAVDSRAVSRSEVKVS